MAREIHLVDQKDNTATVISREMKKGRVVELEIGDNVINIEISEDIIYGHKIAVKPIKKGEVVLKYGLSIGTALVDIDAGEHVHIHNIESNRGRGDLSVKNKQEKERV